ncbi:MAG: class I tRNA ligase family protein [Patescibacteria group bacterium]|nr:class I tRNA ligase family protein [Patescibacteria group bacterium]
MAEQSQKSDVAKREEKILAFWEEHKIFDKSLEKEAPKGEFVFYDGPPFATGVPHSGSLLSSVSKDLIPRYKTMRGYRVRRRWGWDCHGLPIESLVEKKLGLRNKKEIYEIGIEKFNETARSMVLEYVSEWKRYVERVGRFVDFDNSYKTMDPTYMESVWWALAQIHKKGRLYEGRKVLLYCPHCETPLAKAEIAMDNTYKDITEEAVTIKFRLSGADKLGLAGDVFALAWTTTPWTLPGNVALAVGSGIEYGAYAQGEAVYVLAVNRASAYGFSSPLNVFKGKELAGLAYEPLYFIEKAGAHKGKKWEVVAADFVSTEEGTGIVHTAVMYGEDDYALGMREDLPMIPLLNANATYNGNAPEWLQGKYVKKAEAEIKTDLSQRALLFEKKPHTHSYPHCYRCGTPLIYNAVSSWFINMQAVKEKMISENEHVTWIPEHLKHGRFKHILENAPDWTISRNRFWATPLPIWKDAEGNVRVLGSLEELKRYTKKSGNTYYLLRHGESKKNVEGVINSYPEAAFPLTEKGKQSARESAAKLERRPDVIVSSALPRAVETAQTVKEFLGLTVPVEVDARLNEYNHGVFEGRRDADWTVEYGARTRELFDVPPEEGETLTGLRGRLGELMYEMEKKYAGKTILLVSHGWPLAMLSVIAEGAGVDRAAEILDRQTEEQSIPVGGVTRLDFVPLPHNDNYELDLHLPYIDRVALADENGRPLARIPEVVDCWVESGSMPFAEYHYPFENKSEFEKRAPGHFVSEYIAQTRAWFYYMHAVSVHLFSRRSFDNVITTGNVLAADGEKLSKSKQNFTDPYHIFERYGADAFRYYLMSSVVMQAEDIFFKDEEVKEVHNRVVNILTNVHAFYLLYASELDDSIQRKSDHALDRWIFLRLAETIETATVAFDTFDVVRAVRPMRVFIEDLSTWYVRRSRDRVKGENEKDKQEALHTLRDVLHVLSRLIAPVMPFIAEEIYQSVKKDGQPESVHLTEWPKRKERGWFQIFGKQEGTLIVDMERVRKLASLALEARQKANLKVRQPLQSLSVPGTLSAELKSILAEEVNVKEVKTEEKEIVLDTVITPILQEEGEVRETLRFIQELRKQAGLTAKDTAHLVVSGTPEAHAFLERNWKELSGTAKLSALEKGEALHALSLSDVSFYLDVRKA